MSVVSQKNFYIANEGEQLKFGQLLAKACDNRSGVIFLQGELGAGKTTLVRGFLSASDYHGKVKSPSYTLIETYEFEDKNILHLDLYRVSNSEEIVSLALPDLLEENTILLVEWPEHGKEELPTADLTCYIAFFKAGREIRLVANSVRGKDIINNVSARMVMYKNNKKRSD